MQRTQIYLDDEIMTYLKNEKKRTNQSYSQIIRLSLKQNMAVDKDLIIKRMKQAVGSWKDVKTSPEEFLDQIRQDRTV